MDPGNKAKAMDKEKSQIKSGINDLERLYQDPLTISK
jgi:hypothetical protein